MEQPTTFSEGFKTFPKKKNRFPVGRNDSPYPCNPLDGGFQVSWAGWRRRGTPEIKKKTSETFTLRLKTKDVTAKKCTKGKHPDQKEEEANLDVKRQLNLKRENDTWQDVVESEGLHPRASQLSID